MIWPATNTWPDWLGDIEKLKRDVVRITPECVNGRASIAELRKRCIKKTYIFVSFYKEKTYQNIKFVESKKTYIFVSFFLVEKHLHFCKIFLDKNLQKCKFF